MVALWALSACNDRDTPWTLRPGVTEVFSSPSAAIIDATIITDVDREGDRIILLRPSVSTRSTFMYAYLSLSEDLGKTWRHVQVRREIASELGGDTHQIGVHLQDGKVYLMLSRDVGSSLPAWAVFEVDMTTGETTERVIPLTRTGWFSQKRPDGHLRYGLSAGFFGVGPHALFEFDPATGQSTYEPFPCTGMACTTPIFHSIDGGETWDGYTQVQPGLPVCLTHWDVATVTPTQRCVYRPAWPGVDYNYIPTMMFRGTTPYMAWSTGPQGAEQAYATAILPGTPSVSETLLLGPGKISPAFRTGSMVRPRFATYELIENPGGLGYLAHLVEAGPERVGFPVTPCSTDEGCGYEDPPTFGLGQVQWILRLDNNDFLIFYTIVTDRQGGQSIYVARERPTFGPITGAVPPPARTVDLPAGAQPMNTLEKACAVFIGCEPYHSLSTFGGCIQRWSVASATQPGLAAARDRFIAAASSCASLQSVAASACPLECTEAGGSCGPTNAGPCSIEIPYVAGNCGSCDVDGNFLSCAGPDERAYKVACGGGTVCSYGQGCVLPGHNACDAYLPSPSCVGASVRTCAAASQLLTLEDCSLADATCDPSTARCAPTTADGACSPATFQSTCASDTHLLTCAHGQIRYVPCSDLGLSECVREGYGGAFCH